MRDRTPVMECPRCGATYSRNTANTNGEPFGSRDLSLYCDARLPVEETAWGEWEPPVNRPLDEAPGYDPATKTAICGEQWDPWDDDQNDDRPDFREDFHDDC